jgi:hypothetical protein
VSWYKLTRMSVRCWVGWGSRLFFVLAATACSKRSDDAFAPSAEAKATPSAQAVVQPAAAPAPAPAPTASDMLQPADAKTRAQCSSICSRSNELHCKHPETCLPNCLAMQAATPCGREFAGFYACLVGQPVAHFECDEESGVAQIRDGYCDAEQERTVACMNEKMKQ